MNENNQNSDAFIEKAKTTLDRSLDELDSQTLARLDAIRHQALTAKESRKHWWVRPGMAWGGMGGIAMASVVAMVWILNPVTPDGLPYEGGEVNVAEMTLLFEGELPDEAISDEDIELLEEIEFVAWLMEQEDINAG